MTPEAGRGQGIHSPEDRRFVGVSAAALDDYLARNPVEASVAGDRRFDDRLPDYSADGVAEQVRVLNRHLMALDSIDPIGLSQVNAVDLAVLRARLIARVYQLRTLDEPRWNPGWWSPAQALEPLLTRRETNLPAIMARLEGLGEHLESARQTLATMPALHVEQALTELACTPGWLIAELAAVAEANPGAGADLEEAAKSAVAAILEHRQWLAARLPRSTRDPRLGERRYGEVLRLLIGTDASVAEIQRWAEQEVEELTELMRSLASQVLGSSMATRRLIPSALAAVAAAHPVPDDDLIGAAERSLAAARAFTIEHRLVTVPELTLEVAPMPPVRSGTVSVYSEPPGPFAESELARVVVAGPDPSWAPGRQESFRREYNAVMMDALMAHQAIPGHALQAAHARRAAAPTAIRSVFPNALFIEGWACYAQQLLTEAGYSGSAPDVQPAEFALQEVKLRLRGVVNALLDIGFHTGDTDEPQARRLLATAAMAEEGEFVVKWRRVQTSAGDLTMQLLGRRMVADLVQDVSRQHPTWPVRQVNDRILANGAVPPAAAKVLMGLG